MINRNNNDTIVAISTKPGESAIGIVRLSGEQAVNIAEKIFRAKNNKKIRKMASYTMSYGYLNDKNGEIVDQVIVSIMKKPKSYTKEDVVEINCHGGIAATKKVLEICIENGARIAGPGEFTKRAFLNGRIDLSQAEAVADIVRAKTDQSLKIAAKNLKGATGKKIEQIRKQILEILVELEASLDFIEEDLEITPYEELEKKVKEIYEKINILLEDEKKGEIIKNGIKVAIVGKPNVGKSSLLNALAKKERAIVTHIPGTTRDAIEEILYVEGIPLILVDTAGIRKAKNIIEKIGVEKSLDQIEDSELIIMLIDGSQEIDKKDIEIAEKIKEKKKIICINKMDLEKVAGKKQVREKIKEKNILEISAKKATGIEILEKEIKKILESEKYFNIEERVIVNERQKQILVETKEMIISAMNAMKEKMSEEFASSDLKIAYDLLGEITGKTVNEEIINGIFEKFCIGK